MFDNMTFVVNKQTNKQASLACLQSDLSSTENIWRITDIKYKNEDPGLKNETTIFSQKSSPALLSPRIFIDCYKTWRYQFF